MKTLKTFFPSTSKNSASRRAGMQIHYVTVELISYVYTGRRHGSRNKLTKPEMWDFCDDGPQYTFSNIPAAAAAVIASSSRLSSPLPGQAVWFGPSTQAVQSVHHARHLFPLVKLGKTPCFISSLRPSASVCRHNSQTVSLQKPAAPS